MLTPLQIRNFIKGYPIRSETYLDILMGPSWVGKTWIVDNVTDTHSFLISTTTRQMRDGEVDGKEYNFISKDQFESHLKNGEMINTFILHGEYYGYRGIDVDTVIKTGKIPIAIVYYKVLDSFLEKFPNSKLTFVFPPNTPDGINFILDRIETRDKRINESRLTDFYKQMELMYTANSSFTNKYPQGKLFEIEDNESADEVIVCLTSANKPLIHLIVSTNVDKDIIIVKFLINDPNIISYPK